MKIRSGGADHTHTRTHFKRNTKLEPQFLISKCRALICVPAFPCGRHGAVPIMCVVDRVVQCFIDIATENLVKI